MGPGGVGMKDEKRLQVSFCVAPLGLEENIVGWVPGVCTPGYYCVALSGLWLDDEKMVCRAYATSLARVVGGRWCGLLGA